MDLRSDISYWEYKTYSICSHIKRFIFQYFIHFDVHLILFSVYVILFDIKLELFSYIFRISPIESFHLTRPPALVFSLIEGVVSSDLYLNLYKTIILQLPSSKNWHTIMHFNFNNERIFTLHQKKHPLQPVVCKIIEPIVQVWVNHSMLWVNNWFIHRIE